MLLRLWRRLEPHARRGGAGSHFFGVRVVNGEGKKTVKWVQKKRSPPTGKKENIEAETNHNTHPPPENLLSAFLTLRRYDCWLHRPDLSRVHFLSEAQAARVRGRARERATAGFGGSVEESGDRSRRRRVDHWPSIIGPPPGFRSFASS